MLAIAWVNEFNVNNGFAATYPAAEQLARDLVNRAIDDWEAIITDFNYDGDNNPATNNIFILTVVASPISGRGSTGTTFANGLPTQATVTLDDNGGGIGWFFDQTPLDDAEFTAIANSGAGGSGASFQGSFIDINGGFADFYRTIVHEIGHAMGLASSSPSFALTSNPLMTPAGPDPLGGSLYTFHNPNGQYGVNATITVPLFGGGRHLYEGSHPNDLMNSGRVTPVGTPRETLRQFISDFDVQLLADAYRYGHTLPSTLDTAHVTLDSQTGTLLVQGGVTSQGFGQNDTITVDTVGTNIRVQVNNTTELVPTAHVSQIIIAQNGGADSQTVTGISVPVANVQYVVSSNQDLANPTAVLNDLLVDSDPVVPGRQTPLREAIRDANGTPGAQWIYIPRGVYQLTLSGAAGDTQGDLDITSHIGIVGTGAVQHSLFGYKAANFGNSFGSTRRAA